MANISGITNGRDAARRLLGAGSDLVKAARGTDSALGVNKESFDKGQYQAFRKGGKVAAKKSVVDSLIKKDAKADKAQDKKLLKGKPTSVKKEFMKRDEMQDAAVETKYAKGGKTALPKGMARVKTDKKLNGQQNEPALIAKKACGGKMKKAAGGAAKVRHGIMSKSGKINPKAC